MTGSLPAYGTGQVIHGSPQQPATHPIRLTVSDDLERSRLTVFFRLLLAIPHFVWVVLWGIAALVVALITWFATLITGRPPTGLHGFLAAYLRYTTHVYAYVLLAANPFPGFMGQPGSYPVDLEIGGPERQNRWVTGFRLVLAIPAMLLSATLTGGAGGYGGGAGAYASSGGVATVAALFGWFVCLAQRRMPLGFRQTIAFALGYGAQVTGYLFLLTDCYPDSDPATYPVVERRDADPIRLTNAGDLQRSRLTVFFRLLLALPHFVWLSLWGVAAFVAALVNGIATLIAGRPPDALHRFLGAFVRYEAHVYAYSTLLANPFPGFVGKPGSYPVDVLIGEPEQQNRWTVAFRLFLGLPALILAMTFAGVFFTVGLLGWFASLFTARMPRRLENLGGYALRYVAQAYGYFYVLTDRYPYTGPATGELISPPPVQASSA